MPKYKKNKKLHGRVKWFDVTKGVGFIETDDGLEVFVHYSALPIKNGKFIVLKPNQEVEFDILDDKDVPKAVNIKIIN